MRVFIFILDSVMAHSLSSSGLLIMPHPKPHNLLPASTSLDPERPTLNLYAKHYKRIPNPKPKPTKSMKPVKSL